MNPVVLETLKSTKARIVYVVLALMTLFKFIGDFKVPGDRLGYLGSAVAYVWPDLLVLLALVLLLAFRRWWWPTIRKGVATAWTQTLRPNRWLLGTTLVLLAVAAIGLWPRARTAWPQTVSAVDSRWQVYRYAFGFRYSDALRARAVEQLQAGRPETAARLLERAGKWTFGSPTLAENIQELRELAKSRIALSSDLAKGVTRAQAGQLNYVTTAQLTAAYLLNTESDGLRAMLVKRSSKARRFGGFLEPVLAGCGTGSAAGEAAFRDACAVLAAEQFDARVSSCREAARVYCQRMEPATADAARRRSAARGFIASAVGAQEMLAALGDPAVAAPHPAAKGP